MKPARLTWGRSLRLFTILFVAVLLSLFAANVKAQSGLNLEKSGVSHSLISWEKGDEFSVISGKLGIGNQSRSPQAWEDLARTSYAAGDFPEAAKHWRQAVAGFEVGGDWLNQAIALSNLSLTYQQLGDWKEANSAIGLSRSLLPEETGVKSPGELKVIAQILDIQSNGQWEQGQITLALQTGKQATNIYVKLKDNLGWKRSLIAQIKTLQALGLYQQACQAIIPVVESNNLENFTIPSQDCQQLITEKLVTIKESVKKPSNSTFKNIQITGARLLGDVWRQLGYLKESKELLEEVDRVVTQQAYPQEQALILLSLGDTYKSIGNRNKFLSELDQSEKYYQTAIDSYKKSAKVAAKNSFVKVQAQLNLLSLLVDFKIGLAANPKEIKQLRLEILSELNKLPPSHKLVYAEVSLMNSLVKFKNQLKTPNNVSNSSNVNSDKILNYCLPNSAIVAASVLGNIESVSWGWGEVGKLGAKAIALARDLGDFRATAYALGNLGTVYEKNQQWLEAQQCTEQALLLSQNVQLNAPDLAYEWQSQLGRIRWNGAKDVDGAIAAYTAAFNTLQSLRNDLVPISRDGQFDFRDRVEPVYRELVDLLLQDNQPSQENLKQARSVIEALQVAELDNFFRDACVVVNKSEEIDRIADKYDPTAAVIHAIILKDRLAIILKLPGKTSLEYRQTYQPETLVKKTIQNLQKYLVDKSSTPEVVAESEKLYKWLIEPVESLVENAKNVETLVFILDRPLQVIPMGALYDKRSDKYLMEKNYALALVPGLQLLEPKPWNQVKSSKLKVLLGGVDQPQTLEGQDFAKIEKLLEELDGIGKIVATSKRFLNEEFTLTNLQQELALANIPILHIKTHGQFSSDPEKTFIVAFGSLLKSQDLDKLIKRGNKKDVRAIELLVLSACKTAKGDDRAVLGLSGVAIRAGARSTVSSLWVAEDAANTKIIVRFYEELRKPGMTRAKALHIAQKAYFETGKEPYFWAPYIIVGNWL
ncbi:MULTISPECIES: CHAT domain-containing protein [unclassified Microcoleus]|uniref:CHAT domain-containing protein n=1 Tax=unclassified Microcoleus TaxID=2642155 RepID=UPI002FD51531